MVSMDKVSDLIREIAAEEVMPRFRNLKSDEVRDKTKGDPVTEADLATERRLSAGLLAMLPGSVVVGEEGVFEDRSQLELLGGDDPVWLIDPVDGTKNFTEGSDLFAVMVALVRRGIAEKTWVYGPVHDEMVVAELGAGSFINGTRLTGRPAPGSAGKMVGAVHTKYLSDASRPAVEANMASFASNEQLYCSGVSYIQIAQGKLDHALYWRTNPWDHAMGALIVSEAGGRSAYLDGLDYYVAPTDKMGLIAVSDASSWDLVRGTLFPDGVPA